MAAPAGGPRAAGRGDHRVQLGQGGPRPAPAGAGSPGPTGRGGRQGGRSAPRSTAGSWRACCPWPDRPAPGEAVHRVYACFESGLPAPTGRVYSPGAAGRAGHGRSAHCPSAPYNRLRSDCTVGGRVGRRAHPEGTRSALPVEGLYLWGDPRSIGSMFLAPSGGLRWCRTAAAVKVARPTGRTTLTAARTGAGCSPRRGRR